MKDQVMNSLNNNNFINNNFFLILQNNFVLQNIKQSLNSKLFM